MSLNEIFVQIFAMFIKLPPHNCDSSWTLKEQVHDLGNTPFLLFSEGSDVIVDTTPAARR